MRSSFRLTYWVLYKLHGIIQNLIIGVVCRSNLACLMLPFAISPEMVNISCNLPFRVKEVFFLENEPFQCEVQKLDAGTFHERDHGVKCMILCRHSGALQPHPAQVKHKTQ